MAQASERPIAPRIEERLRVDLNHCEVVVHSRRDFSHDAPFYLDQPRPVTLLPFSGNPPQLAVLIGPPRKQGACGAPGTGVVPPAGNRCDVLAPHPLHMQRPRRLLGLIAAQLANRVVPPRVNLTKASRPLVLLHDRSRVPDATGHVLCEARRQRLHQLRLGAVVQRPVPERAELSPSAGENFSIRGAHGEMVRAAGNLHDFVLSRVHPFRIPGGLGEGVHGMAPKEGLPFLRHRDRRRRAAADLGDHAPFERFHLHGTERLNGSPVAKLTLVREPPAVNGSELVNDDHVVLPASDLERVERLLPVKERGIQLVRHVLAHLGHAPTPHP
mmetsp:Transcript_10013/g.20304  ORF Transcript_10013/g.20304 Transcript_10013/m.20304 type:complete len:329 (-) Transcript_10013:953-1939(-)